MLLPINLGYVVLFVFNTVINTAENIMRCYTSVMANVVVARDERAEGWFPGSWFTTGRPGVEEEFASSSQWNRMEMCVPATTVIGSWFLVNGCIWISNSWVAWWWLMRLSSDIFRGVKWIIRGRELAPSPLRSRAAFRFLFVPQGKALDLPAPIAFNQWWCALHPIFCFTMNQFKGLSN